MLNFSIQRFHFLLLDVLQPSQPAGPTVISALAFPPSQTGPTAGPGVENHLALKLIFLHHNCGKWRLFLSALVFWLHPRRFSGGGRRFRMRLLVRRFYFRNLLWNFTFFGAEFWSLCLFGFLNSPGIDRLQGFLLQTFSHPRLPSISFICLRCSNLRFPLPFSLFNRILVFLSHLFLPKSW